MKLSNIFALPIVGIVAFLMSLPVSAEEWVEECNLTPSDDLVATDYESPLCTAAREALNQQKIKTLQRVIKEQQVRSLAKFLSATPAANGISFTYAPLETSFEQYCCSCVPGKTCSVTVIGDVCTPAVNGSCPAGNLRTICTIDAVADDDVCDSID
jgi:hypothetical protein